MKSVAELLNEAKSLKPKENLAEYEQVIITLRAKNYSWRDIAKFLNDRGIETDHSKIFRFMQKNRKLTMTTSKDFIVPSAEQYIQALKSINISDGQKKMLGYHYLAHNRTVTYTELAEAAGYPSFNTANSMYGKLGRLLGEALSMTFIYAESRDEPFYSSAIGMDNPYKTEEQAYQLVMHHELAKALERLGWF
ncbi:MAG TPA: hypothetical protein PKL69_02575 [Agitococcus sp.]|nr:hypothetical protein [Agitococcus sp.]HMY29367.1 hypothetical protein [Agitococcus sp.]HNA21617.1 hypothetical protein [Agitococcus sp.]HNC86831.1 hypothetical protein [Agitococcus sp.]HNG47876.1 hypothetical protein [Agitococcus sp.]